MNKTKIKKPITNGVAKVPIVIQLEALECGAASLAMILAYYDKWIPLEQVRLDCGVSRDGSNAMNVIKAARYYGLTANGYKLEPEELREDGYFPCMVHWGFNHFVVVDGFKNNRVYLNDPARGEYSVSIEEFDDNFTGITILFEPSESFVPGGKPKSTIEFAKKRLVGLGASVLFVTAISTVSSILGIIDPIFSRIFLDKLLTNENPEWFTPFIYALGAFYFIFILTKTIASLFLMKINGKLSIVGNMSFMWKVIRLPMSFFSQRMSGDILSRQNSNVTVSNTLVNTIAPLVLDTAMMIFYLVVMIRYSWLLTLIGVVSVITNLLLSKIISKKRVEIARLYTRDYGQLYGTAVSGVQMIETIKASGAENGFFDEWAGYHSGVNKQLVKYQGIDLTIGIIPTIISTLTGLVILGTAVYLTMEGNFTLGMITAFQGFYSSFIAPATNLISAGQTIQEMRTNMERIEDVMEYPEDVGFCDISVPEGEKYRKLSGNIEIKDITFGYSPLAEPLIKNLSMEIKAGQRIAFVGTSGCGKSTLSKLISGLYHPKSGEILFDGKKITEIDHSIFTGSVAVVDQDIILFEDTIANNIKMWDNSIEDFEMILAARDAHIHDDIIERPDGYNHRLIEGGRDFSGGQRQRLEIARVLAQDPTIIILDEATSALDAKTEYDVVNSIKDRGITCIIIAHRLSTIRDCDQIIVLDHGEIAEKGTHDELMKLNGFYSKLVTNE